MTTFSLFLLALAVWVLEQLTDRQTHNVSAVMVVCDAALR